MVNERNISLFFFISSPQEQKKITYFGKTSLAPAIYSCCFYLGMQVCWGEVPRSVMLREDHRYHQSQRARPQGKLKTLASLRIFNKLHSDMANKNWQKSLCSSVASVLPGASWLTQQLCASSGNGTIWGKRDESLEVSFST